MRQHRLGESFFILTALVAVYLVACLVSYDPTDPGPFNSVASQEVSNVRDAIDVDSGLGHLCALQRDGTVECWGSNYYGQLGRNTQASSPDPQPVLNLSAAWQLAVGKYHACVLITNSTPGTDDIQCWGLNSDGQLGDGTHVNSPIPVFVK